MFKYDYYNSPLSIMLFIKKSLKIPKGKSEGVNPNETDNTMAKTKRTKGQTTIYKTLHRKLKIELQEAH